MTTTQPSASPVQAKRGPQRLSVIVLTMNEEVNLPGCIQSLNGLDYDLYVVDSGSSDRTIEIAKAAGAFVVQHPFENYGAQRNWAQSVLPFKTDWLLHLDADERLTPELVKEIAAVLKDPPPEISGYMLRKRTIFMGRWIRHGAHYPSYHLRLFLKDKGRCEDRKYDQHYVAEGKVLTLKHDYEDVITSDLSTWSHRHVRWAEMEVEEQTLAQREGSRVKPRLLGTPIERRRWLRDVPYKRAPLFVRPFLYWAYRYFLRLGFLDGTEGLVFHFLQGFWYRFLVDSKLYELRKRQKAARKAAG
jgi:glycosyltransferase involved in cell wall biosynthesis